MNSPLGLTGEIFTFSDGIIPQPLPISLHTRMFENTQVELSWIIILSSPSLLSWKLLFCINNHTTSLPSCPHWNVPNYSSITYLSNQALTQSLLNWEIIVFSVGIKTQTHPLSVHTRMLQKHKKLHNRIVCVYIFLVIFNVIPNILIFSKYSVWWFFYLSIIYMTIWLFGIFSSSYLVFVFPRF